MPDLEYIARKALAARQFEHQIGAVTFRLQLLTKLEASICYAQAAHAGRADGSTWVRYERAVALAAIVGWSGVTAHHVLVSAQPDDPLPWEAAAVPLLLDAQPEWEAELLQVLMQRVAQRQAAEDAAAKN